MCAFCNWSGPAEEFQLVAVFQLQAEDAAESTVAAILNTVGVSQSEQDGAALNAINYSSAKLHSNICQTTVLTMYRHHMSMHAHTYVRSACMSMHEHKASSAMQVWGRTS